MERELPDPPLGAEQKCELLACAITQLSEFVFVLLDVNGCFTSWHPGVKATFGYSEEEFLGQHLKILYTPEEQSNGAVEKELETAKKEGRASDTRWLLRKGGGRVFVDGLTIALRDKEGGPTGFGKVIHDVTTRKTAEDEQMRLTRSLENMGLELERSNRELEEFARIASHDLASPIISTRWLVDLTLSKHKGLLDENGRESLEHAAANLERMLDLVEAVLKHARVGRNTIRAETPVSSEGALMSALANLSLEIERAGAAITNDSLPDVHVKAEPLAQLFQNLVSNSIKYRRPDFAPQVHITVDGEPGAWRFGFRDNGIGIAPQFRERIFQPMQRLHGHEIPGSGIGLATCKKIVERVGGSIWVESTEGEGSVFYVMLP